MHLRNLNTVILIFYLVLWTSVFSQDIHEYDSLENIINTTSNDTAKITAYLRTGELLEKTGNDSAVESIEKALEIAKKINWGDKEAYCYQKLGYIYASSGDDEKSIGYYKKSIKRYEELGQTKFAANAYSDLGFIYHRFDRYDKALEMYKKALSLYSAPDDNSKIALTLNRIGLAKTELGTFDGALEAHLEALRIYEELNDEPDIAAVNNNIGNVYNRLGNNEKALQYYQTAIDYREKLGQKQQVIASLTNIGAIYCNILDFDNALKSFNKALEYVNENTNTQWVVTLYINLSSTFFDMKEYEKAIENLEIAERYAKKYNYKVSLSICKLNLGMIYLDMGKTEDALIQLKKGLPVAEQSNVLPLLAEFYHVLSIAYENMEDYKKAYEYFELHSALNDSVYSMESAKQIAEMQTKFDAGKKDKVIALLQTNNEIKDITLKKQKTERNIFFIISGFLLLLLLFIVNRYMIRTRTNKLLKEKAGEIERVNSELIKKNQLIKQQKLSLEKYTAEQKQLLATKDKFFSIIAHDLKNPFNAIIGLSKVVFDDFDGLDERLRIDFIKQINKAANEVYKLVENLLNWSRAKSGMLDINPVRLNVKQVAEEAVSVHLTAAANKNISLSVTIDNNLFAYADKNMINTVFRNLISNAIKFTPQGGRVTIEAEKIGDQVKVYVKDTGIGITKENALKIFNEEERYSTKGTGDEKGSGLGLILCKEFIERNNGTIGVESIPDSGSTFYFTLPANSKKIK